MHCGTKTAHPEHWHKDTEKRIGSREDHDALEPKKALNTFLKKQHSKAIAASIQGSGGLCSEYPARTVS